MNRIIVLALLLLAIAPLTVHSKQLSTNLPRNHLLTIENQTGHKIFIIEEKSFKKINPDEAVVLYWKEPLNKSHERVIRIFYGGNVKDNAPELALNKKAKQTKRLSKESRKAALGSEPTLIAQLRTNQPGTITLSYDENGILKMERL